MWGFDSLQRMKEFAVHLSAELSNLGEKSFSESVKGFAFNSFTTSTEYLGEFRIVLKDLLNIRGDILTQETKSLIQEAVAAINKAFGQ
jgi:hypothetical protein